MEGEEKDKRKILWLGKYMVDQSAQRTGRDVHIHTRVHVFVCMCTWQKSNVKKRRTLKAKETTWRNRQNSLTETWCVVCVPSFFYFCLSVLYDDRQHLAGVICFLFFFRSWANGPTMPTLIRINSYQTTRRVTGVHSLESGSRQECRGFDVYNNGCWWWWWFSHRLVRRRRRWQQQAVHMWNHARTHTHCMGYKCIYISNDKK